MIQAPLMSASDKILWAFGVFAIGGMIATGCSSDDGGGETPGGGGAGTVGGTTGDSGTMDTTIGIVMARGINTRL